MPFQRFTNFQHNADRTWWLVLSDASVETLFPECRTSFENASPSVTAGQPRGPELFKLSRVSGGPETEPKSHSPSVLLEIGRKVSAILECPRRRPWCDCMLFPFHNLFASTIVQKLNLQPLEDLPLEAFSSASLFAQRDKYGEILGPSSTGF
jgi:hypothetical protein